MTVHEVLVAGRNLIAQKGWSQRRLGHWSNPSGTCAYVACWYGSGLPDSDAVDLANECVDALGFADNGMLYAWNDTPGRTEDEVLVLFDKAIAATAPAPDLDFLKDPADAQTA